MSRVIVFEDGTEVIIPKDKFWCSLLDGTLPEERVPVQGKYNEIFFIEELSHSIEDEEILIFLDFWNYMGCEKRMFFGYLLIFDKFLRHASCKQNSFVELICNIKFGFLKTLEKKDYCTEMVIVLKFLILFESDEDDVFMHTCENEEILTPFIIFFDSFYWKEFGKSPLVVCLLNTLKKWEDVEFNSLENDDPRKEELLEKLFSSILEKSDKKEIILGEEVVLTRFEDSIFNVEAIFEYENDHPTKGVNLKVKIDSVKLIEKVKKTNIGSKCVIVDPYIFNRLNGYLRLFPEFFEFVFPPEYLSLDSTPLLVFDNDRKYKKIVFDTEKQSFVRYEDGSLPLVNYKK